MRHQAQIAVDVTDFHKNVSGPEQINSHSTHISTHTIIKDLAEQSGHPILSRVMTGAVLHGHVFWLDCHLEGCLEQPQGHHIQFTWKTTFMLTFKYAHCHSLCPSFSHTHTHVHQSNLFLAVLLRDVLQHPCPPSQHIHIHLSLIGGCWVGRVRVGAKTRGQWRWGQSFMWIAGSKENSWSNAIRSTSFTRPLLLPVGHRGDLTPHSSQSCHLCILSFT